MADWMKRMHGHSHTSILSGTDTVAVQSHGDPSVGVPGVYEVFWQVEVGGHDTRKGVVAPFVGGVRAPSRSAHAVASLRQDRSARANHAPAQSRQNPSLLPAR